MKNAITEIELFEQFNAVAAAGSSIALQADDEELNHAIFEDFDVGVSSLYHPNAIGRLIDAGLINYKVAYLCLCVRTLWIELCMGTRKQAPAIRKDANFLRISRLCDRIIEDGKRV